MKNRNLEYEKKFKAYLFKGDLERFKSICKDVGIVANLKCFDTSSKQEQPLNEQQEDLMLEEARERDSLKKPRGAGI